MLTSSTLFILLVMAYGLAIIAGGIFVLDSERRQALQNRIQRAGNWMLTMFCGIGDGVQRTSGSTGRMLLESFRRPLVFILHHRLHAAASMGLLALPIILVLFFLSSRSLPGYQEMPQTTDPVVLALLRGEQLAPPPPMPPEAFITPEVAAIRQDLGGASREWLALDADFRQRLLIVFQLMEKKGYPMALLEGYRSPERQTYLASLGPQVTNAGAFQSYHQFGLAADSAFVRNDKLVISEKDPWAMQGYRLYGELAESVGLVWGGRWKMMDFGHVELRRQGTIQRK
ncbi:peptidoglycan L-alanyl-D-glutamate endopeptidase CwlK [Paucimonas lemoignei]|uniref:Peptidoglycan L-alanyl-D-glutamate endopeptidase CwlK n=1 Tax=Paucimonas lemoignei TaxID=29443 RepID=A0A4R3I424_PAULE|nr:M15 family metallopeptidase [Paucimonas lemoignei]TCS39465.1 peptidoglycan L-alanyl-D-glutamate endopeptidase CwlK [Paucimonas lemoignei]